ncbi:MAG: winged helix-turn-helix domain-containing protein [Thermoplasmata archaeon]
MAADDFQSSLKRLLWWTFISTRGGNMRLKIMKSILDSPKNANRLSSDTGVNYRTIEHHIKILLANNLVTVQGEGYGRVYFPSPLLTKNFHIFEEILDREGTMRRKD